MATTGSELTPGARALARYVSGLSAERKRRVEAIVAALRHAAGGVDVAVRPNGLTFSKGGRRIAVTERRHHLSVHLPAKALLAGIRARHPELDCGVSCVRIRDSQHLPLYELREAFRAALE